MLLSVLLLLPHDLLLLLHAVLLLLLLLLLLPALRLLLLLHALLHALLLGCVGRGLIAGRELIDIVVYDGGKHIDTLESCDMRSHCT